VTSAAAVTSTTAATGSSVAATGSSVATTYTSAATSSIATATSITTASNSSPISSGAIAGIVIGGVAAVIGIGLLLWFVVFRRRRKQMDTTSPDTKTSAPERAELGGNEKSKPQELHGGHRVSELGTEGNFPLHLVEMDSERNH
jgi:uncharacterized oligopeptide transporter (OPT) family protein